MSIFDIIETDLGVENVKSKFVFGCCLIFFDFFVFDFINAFNSECVLKSSLKLPKILRFSFASFTISPFSFSTEFELKTLLVKVL